MSLYAVQVTISAQGLFMSKCSLFRTGRIVLVSLSLGPALPATAILLSTCAKADHDDRISRLERVETDSGPRWGFGLQSPLDLLTYTHGDSSDPEYCRDPKKLLEQIRTAILDDGPEAGHRKCQPDALLDADGTSLLRIKCPIHESAGDCDAYYMGQLWTEKFENSTSDYVLRGYGWVRRSCSAGRVYDASDVRRDAGDPSNSFSALLRACR